MCRNAFRCVRARARLNDLLYTSKVLTVSSSVWKRLLSVDTHGLLRPVRDMFACCCRARVFAR